MPLTDQPFKYAKAGVIARFERAYLAELLDRSRGNISEAARLCGKERRDLGRLIRKHGLGAFASSVESPAGGAL